MDTLAKENTMTFARVETKVNAKGELVIAMILGPNYARAFKEPREEPE
jgi:hypothetical protein